MLKPPYSVPTMREIAKTRKSGFSLVSTFSGCGGSCLGFEMAGFRVLWASEFIEAARDTYRRNHKNVPIDARDIRQVRASEILTRTGLSVGELDVLEGSPPCSDFSTAGRRSGGWGRVKKYSDSKQRVDDLFFEFIRLIDGIRPKVFVAENVSGLVKGVAKGYFKKILAEMKALDYEVEARLIDAQWLGVPQSRKRLIFVGVRNDLNRRPVFPKPFTFGYSLREAIDLKRSKKSVDVDEGNFERYAIYPEWKKLKVGEKSDKYISLVRPDPDRPCPTITQEAGHLNVAGVTHPFEPRKFSLAELRRICAFPDDFVLTGSYQQQYERLGRAVPPLMMREIALAIRDQVLVPLRDGRGR